MDIAAPTDRVPAVWQRGINGTNQRVAIIEDRNISSSCLNIVSTRTGIPLPANPPDHSTRVANIVACNADPYRGVAYGAQIIDAGFDNANWPGPSSEQDAVAALTWAVASPQNARTVNVSQRWEYDNEINWMDRAFDYWGRQQMVTLVVAAGNAGNSGGSLGSPAKAWNVISVGGSDDRGTADWSDDRMASFSSYVDPTSGPNGHGDREKPEVVAPSVQITTLGRGGTVTTDDGTSYAAPQVAGLAALLMKRSSGLMYWPEAVKAIIMASAVHNIEVPSDIPSFQDLKDGAGAIDAALADTIATTRQDSGVVCNNPCWWGNTTSSANPPSGGSIYQYFTASRGERIRVAISWFASADAPLTPPNLARDELLTNYQLYVYKPSGGAPVGYTASWDNNYELADFIAPESGQYQIRIYRQPEGDYNESSNSIGIAWVKDATYLPDLRNKDGWVSTIYIRSYGKEPRHIEIPFFNANGQYVGATACDTDPISTEQCHLGVDNLGGLPSGTTGTGVVNGSEDLTVVVQHQYGGELDESNGIAIAGGAGSLGWEQVDNAIEVPIVKRAWGGRSSNLFVANAGPSDNLAVVQLYDATTGSFVWGTWFTLHANGSISVTASGCTPGLCTARIYSNNSLPLAVSIMEQTDGTLNNRSSFTAFSAGAATNFVPMVKKNAGGQSSGISVENLGSQPTSISLMCYAATGNGIACGTRTNVAPKATVVFILNGADGANLPDGFVGSAVVNATGARRSLR
jgi:hypothetical protein